ncbi:unnamed protein product [Larinioides sclopetarius]
MSSIQHRRKVVEQLRREAAIRRINVSTAIEDLKFCKSSTDAFVIASEFPMTSSISPQM